MEQHALVGVVVVLLGHLLPAVAVSLPQLLVAHLLDLERRQTERSEVITLASAKVLMPTGTRPTFTSAYLLKTPPAWPPSRCSLIVLCI